GQETELTDGKIQAHGASSAMLRHGAQRRSLTNGREAYNMESRKYGDERNNVAQAVIEARGK
ncbi:hypothetical protein, partial [Klebsiella pneumoniae]|uniref:hypothetical protein n=1 Tax=Klebsiella pneumoniae TaxID=573 RepID=UPI00197AC1FF